MSASYTGNYLKIYLTQGVSILLGILSLLVVVPHVSSDKDIYGIYSLCISTLMFLSYADIGFFSAGVKYAAEYYELKNKKDELGVIGFSSFVLLAFSLLIAVGYVLLGLSPGILISGIESNPQAYAVARKLFFIMAVFSPSIVVQRMAFAVYNIRVQDYINQYITIAGNIIKILSVFVFFSNGRYMLVEYFFFIQAVSLLSPVISLIIAKFKFGVDVGYLIKSIKWDGEYYGKTKDLAIASFLSTLAWVAYYELDQVVIAKMFGSSAVAVFSVAFTLLSYVRTFYGAYFSPYSARINHLRVSPDRSVLQNFYHNIIKISIPVVIIPQLVLWMFVKDFIVCWSGPQYLESVSIARILLLCNLFAFISYPGGLLLTALEKHRMIRYTSVISVVLYWIGVFILKDISGVRSFAIMKLTVFIFMGLVYLYASYKFLDMSLGRFLRSLAYQVVLAVCAVLVLSHVAHFEIELSKGLINLMMVCLNMIFVIVAAFAIFTALDRSFREFVFGKVKGLIKR